MTATIKDTSYVEKPKLENAHSLDAILDSDPETISWECNFTYDSDFPPDIKRYCSHEDCSDEMRFAGFWVPLAPEPDRKAANPLFRLSRTIMYLCKHCRETWTVVLLHTKPLERGGLVLKKLGEWPRSRPPMLKAAQNFFRGSDWDLYKKARTCEGNGLGIGAAIYYRRIVENQWTKLIDRLILVAQKTGDEQVAQDLQAEKGNWQFSNSIEGRKAAIPARLKMTRGGHNPLLLLHSALSGDIHKNSDSVSLENAKDARKVLEALLARMSEILNDEQELEESVKRLAGRTNPAVQLP